MIQVELFDEENEKDLEFKMNSFLKDLQESDLIDIKYSISSFALNNGEQIFCYSAMIIYRKIK